MSLHLLSNNVHADLSRQISYSAATPPLDVLPLCFIALDSTAYGGRIGGQRRYIIRFGVVDWRENSSWERAYDVCDNDL
jgi:hypothetical protein